MLGYILLLLMIGIVILYHVELVYSMSKSRIMILVIMISLFIFVCIFAKHAIEANENDYKYDNICIENLTKLEDNSIVNLNNKSFLLLADILKHPIFHGKYEYNI